MDSIFQPSALAAEITRSASKQTYYTMRWLADRNRVQQGLQGYAYFRWVDDRLDKDCCSQVERLEFLERQQFILANLVAGKAAGDLEPEEMILAEMLFSDPVSENGLRLYARHMMQVMAFDTKRRGQLISQSELESYTHHLAVGVTELLHYLIGSSLFSPKDATRYAAASAAHIVHMLRDTYEDAQAGYFNVPSEVLKAGGIGQRDFDHPAYQSWVKERIQLASRLFREARSYLSRVESLRCRLAGFTYMSRFESVLALIQKDDYVLRSEYPRRRSLGGVATFLGSLLSSLMRNPGRPAPTVVIPAAEPRKYQ
jgi:phytoene/squalene synthetase